MLYIFKTFFQSCKPDSPRRKVKAIYFIDQKKIYNFKCLHAETYISDRTLQFKSKKKLLKFIYHLKLDSSIKFSRAHNETKIFMVGRRTVYCA